MFSISLRSTPQLEKITLDSSFLFSVQNKSVFFGINQDKLDENQTRLERNNLSSNGYITEIMRADLDLTISDDEFDGEFLSGQKIFFNRYSHFLLRSQSNTP